MAQDTGKITVLYRMAEHDVKNTQKTKPAWINNISCLRNFVDNIGENVDIIVFGDRLEKATTDQIDDLNVDLRETTAHGNNETFLEVLDYALENLSGDDIVYFVEDDYLHRPGAGGLIREGLKRADYVSLYDHPDKYDGRQTRLFLTDSAHWQYTVSTTMTFATKVKTLAFDEKIIRMCTNTDNGNPADHWLFSTLTGQYQRRLATPIPGYATHGETNFLSPTIEWSRL